MQKRIGKQTVRLQTPVSILATASTVGQKEGDGPLGAYFDVVEPDSMMGEDSWEKAESRFVAKNMELALKKANLEAAQMDYVLCGDLLNQCIGTTFGIKDFGIPFLGLFGACATVGEAMSVGSMLIDGGFAEHILCGASSHFCSAEKQFRFPLPLGIQRPQSTTWTVTGDGAMVLAKNKTGPFITEITTGKIIDMGVTDANNMGAAMAPAAVDVLLAHFQDTGRTPEDYDIIVSGDLGSVGHQIVIELMQKEGYDMQNRYTDCGLKIYDPNTQDTHAGGSGCACAAVTFCSYFYPQLKEGKLKRMLFLPTGALLSADSVQQKLPIPAISHAVVIESALPNERNEKRNETRNDKRNDERKSGQVNTV